MRIQLVYMDVRDAIVTRRSIRKFKDVPIPRGILSDILIAGQLAPISGNSQSNRFILIDDEDAKAKVADACFAQHWMTTAPVFIVVCSDIDRIEKLYPGRGKSSYSYQNASAAAQNMIIMASGEGLASCWVADFNERQLKDVLNIPDTYMPVVVIPFGYANEKVPMPAKADLLALTYLNRFGNRFSDVDWVFKDYAASLTKTGKRSGNSIKKSFSVIKESLFGKQ